MSGRGRVKVIKKVIKANLPSGPVTAAAAAGPGLGLGLPSDIGTSLNECLFDANLAFAKFGKMIRIIEQFIGVLKSVIDAKMFPQFEKPNCQFVAIYNQLQVFARESCAGLYGTQQVPDPLPAYDSLSKAKKDAFQPQYENMRGSHCVKLLIQSCDKLVPYKTHIENIDALDGHFLETIPGISFVPFADFDVKDAYVQTQSKAKREFILVFLNKLYTYGHNLYLEYVAPDMNVEQMTSVVTNALGQLRHIPQLARCNAAFDLIEKSISMLQDNFGEYYTDFLQSHSSSTIFENFIIDVAKNSKSKKKSAILAHQFNEIIKYYREVSKNAGPNPQAEMLFKRFSQFNGQLGVRNLGSKTAAEKAPASAPAASSGAGTSHSSDIPDGADVAKSSESKPVTESVTTPQTEPEPVAAQVLAAAAAPPHDSASPSTSAESAVKKKGRRRK